MKKTLLISLIFALITFGLFAAKTRGYTQVLRGLGDTQFPDVTNTATQPSAADYTLKAWNSVRPAEIISTQTNTNNAIRIFRFGAGTEAVPYETCVFLQFANFLTDWNAGDILHFEITKISTNVTFTWDLTIPDNTSNNIGHRQSHNPFLTLDASSLFGALDPEFSLDLSSNYTGAAIFKDGVDTGFITPYSFTGITSEIAGVYSVQLENVVWDRSFLYDGLADASCFFIGTMIPGEIQNPSPADGTVITIAWDAAPIPCTLSWEAPQGPAPTGYKLFWMEDEAIDLGAALLWNSPALDAGTYTWKVVAYISDSVLNTSQYLAPLHSKISSPKSRGEGTGSFISFTIVREDEPNRPPEIDLPAQMHIYQNESLSFSIYQYASDPDGNALTATVSPNPYISAEINADIITLYPATNWTGSQVLTITVNDNVVGNPLWDQDTVEIVVTNPLLIDFSTNSTLNNNIVLDSPDTVPVFSASCNAPFTLVSWEWDFDDDGIVDSSLPNPQPAYSSTGLKNVRLSASDGIHYSSVVKTGYITVLPGEYIPPALVDEDLIFYSDNTYNIGGELQIEEGVNLIVQPGASVNMLTQEPLVINGNIVADGAVFQNSRVEEWGGIVLNAGATNSSLSNLQIMGAATALELNDCSPTLNNLSLITQPSSRTPGTALKINSDSAPLIQTLQIQGFGTAIKAERSGAGHPALNLNDVTIQRGIPNPAATDRGIVIQGDYWFEAQGISIEGYPCGVEIYGTQPSQTRARLTGSRVVQNESNRSPGTAIYLSEVGFVHILEDSLLGFDNGIIASIGQGTGHILEMSDVVIDRSNQTPSPTCKAIVIQGDYWFEAQNLSIEGYPNGVEIYGTQPSQTRARLTGSRVVQNESNRSPGTAIYLSEVGFVHILEDSLSGFDNPIVASVSQGTDYSFEISKSKLSKQVYSANSTAININGFHNVRADSLIIENYANAIVTGGGTQYSVGYNRLFNCGSSISTNSPSASMQIRKNIISRDQLYGGQQSMPALDLILASAQISNNTIYAHPACLKLNGSTSASLIQNILWPLSASSSLIQQLASSTLNATYNDIRLDSGVFPGIGNINSDPRFAAPQSQNLNLGVKSRCIDAGDPAWPHDPDGSRADMGALFFDQNNMVYVTDFTCDVQTGPHPLSVHFLDDSAFCADTWAWDFNLDGIIDSTDPNPTWIYTMPGIYSVSLHTSGMGHSSGTVFHNLINVWNLPPQVIQPIADLSLQEDFGMYNILLSEHFSDSNSDPLSYTVALSNELVTYQIEGQSLQLFSVQDAHGTVNVSITADDGYNPLRSNRCMRESCSTSFDITILPENDAPQLVLPFENLTLQEDFGSWSISLSEHFSDPDDDPLSYTVALSNELVTYQIEGQTLQLFSVQDAHGSVTVTVTANDGYNRLRSNRSMRDSCTASFGITILPVNDAPQLVSVEPADSLLCITVGESIDFGIEAYDVDSQLTYSWLLDGQNQNNDAPVWCHIFKTAASYTLTVIATDGLESVEWTWSIIVDESATDDPLIPAVTELLSNFPNPFREGTTIRFANKDPGWCDLAIYNSRGQQIKRFVNGNISSGWHQLYWDGSDNHGQKVSAGIYLVRMTFQNKVFTRKILLLR